MIDNIERKTEIDFGNITFSMGKDDGSGVSKEIISNVIMRIQNNIVLIEFYF